MGVRERREREKEELQQVILDAASELFAQEGYANVSMRKIADKIEYSPTTIYLYFKDKTDLLNQICDETFKKLIERVAVIETTENNPLQCLRKGMRAYVDFGLEFPNHYEVTFINPLAEFLGEEHPYEGSMGQRAFDYIRQKVTQSIESGLMKNGDVDVLSQTLWAGIHGVTSLLIGYSDFPFVDKDVLIDSVIDTLLAGLKP
jgi:AcrR family transcriptional regulator